MDDTRFENLPPHQRAVVSEWATEDRAKRVILEQQDTINTLRAENERYLSLLKEIATAKSHFEQTSEWTCAGVVTLESIQRHVRQQLEKWGVKTDE